MSLSRFSPSDSFSNLTSVPFFLICDYLTINQMFNCAQVNRHWRTETLNYLGIKVKSLLLVTFKSYEHGGDPFYYSRLPSRPKHAEDLANDDGSPLILQPRHNCPPYHKLFGSFTHSLAPKLTHFCPQLNKLVCSYVYLDGTTHDATIHLLTSFPKLSSLILDIGEVYFSKYKMEQFKKLFDAINLLSELKQLSFELREPLGFEPDLPVLGWVHEFSFYSRDQRDILYQSLIAYAPENVHLTNIVYVTAFPFQVHSNLRSYLDNERGQVVAPKFSVIFTNRFDGRSRPVPARMLDDLVSHFTSLSCLQVKVRVDDLSYVLRTLAKLPNLIDLYLYNDDKNREEVLDLIPDYSLGRSLPRLRSLHFGYFVTNHRNLKRFYLSHFFPRLQVLVIVWKQFWEGNYCGACGPCHRELNPDAIDKSLNREIFSDDRHREALEFCARGALEEWKETVSGKGTLKNIYFSERNVDMSQIFNDKNRTKSLS